GVAQWLRLQMHDSITYENHPSTKTDASTWQTCLYRFAEPLDVTPGQTVVVRAAHNRSAVWFACEALE
ncbi:MAG: hypothetical protein K8S22_12370, partial [Betaproteobacteria bacterium]|nr:hypothetical protein [Betaproteobacteria bacterium]